MPYIFRSSITVKGKRLYAKQYGRKAFRIWVDDINDGKGDAA